MEGADADVPKNIISNNPLSYLAKTSPFYHERPLTVIFALNRAENYNLTINE
jgi:hypothetical protein